MHRRLLATALLALLSLAGCGGGDGGGGDTTAGTGGGGQTIDVSATEFAFTPADLEAEPGRLTIVLTNDGTMPHAITVEGNGVETTSNTINPGESTELTLDLAEGTYEIYCPIGNHRQEGMVGALTVGSGGGGGTGGGTMTDGGGGGTTGDDSGTETGSGTGSDYRY
jgi:plastocyanin